MHDLDWIDGFESGDTLWDVGANVGHYSLYAAARGCQVLAFEPGAANYYVLNASIEKSGLANRITAYCIALTDGRQLGQLNMQTTDYGGAESSFNTTRGYDGTEFVPVFRQGMVGYSINGFVSAFDPPFPNHIKIDVDGIEDRIVAGASTTLADPRLQSISIELDEARPDYTDMVIAVIEAGGLALAAKKHAAMFDEGPYRSIHNYQFLRSPIPTAVRG